MASPICTVADGAGAPQSTTNGTIGTPGNTITIALVSNAGVGPWTLTCYGTDETNAAATINAGLTINALAKTATFTMPAAGSSLLFRSVINNGLGANQQNDPTATTTFAVKSLTAAGYKVGAVNELLEGNATFGWLSLLNQALRLAPSGTGVATYTIDGASGAIAKGQCVCLATGGLTVTLATSAALTASGAVLGVATTAGTAGQSVIVAIEAMVPNSVTGLGGGTAGPVRVNTSTSVLQRVTSFGTSDYPVGYCNTAGDVTMVRGITVGVGPTGTAGGALGGSYPNPTIALASNTGLSGTLDPSKVGGVLGSTAAGSLTTGKVLRVTGTSASDWGAVDLTNASAISGALPAANLTTGVLREQTVATGTNVVPIDAGTAPTTAPGTTKANIYADTAGLHHQPASTQLIDEGIGAAVQGTLNTQAGIYRKFIFITNTSGAVTSSFVYAVPTGKSISVWVQWNARNTSTGDCAGARGFFVFKNVSGTVTQATSDDKGAVVTTNAGLTAGFAGSVATSNAQINFNGVTALTLDWTAYIEILVN